MALAIADFLRAAGLPLAGELQRTPERVAQLWAEDFLDGYAKDVDGVLGELHPSPNAGLVCVTGIEFQSACPHHLLPYRGLCHLAYLPGSSSPPPREARGRLGGGSTKSDSGGVAGFSRLAALVDALAHRLVLQEALSEEIARTLLSATRARGAGCILEAEQACLSCRDGRKARARTRTSAYLGELSRRSELRQELRMAIAGGASLGQTR